VPRRTRTYLPAEERRRRIIEAAQQVFAHTSLHRARTRQLAQAAQVNQATLFEHFSSKEDLFMAAVVQPLREAMQGMRERAREYRQAASQQDLVALGEKSAYRHVESMLEIYPLLSAALFSDSELGRKLYREQIVPMIKERGDAMRGVVKSDVDPELMALANFGIFFAIAMDHAFRGRKPKIDTIAKQITNLMAFGFMPERLR
jgi:TetR/AcrR family transcriptional regulator